METKFNIKLPFFVGWYESDLENSDTPYYAIKEEVEYYNNELGGDFTEDDFDFEYDRRRDDVSEQFINAFKRYMPEVITSLTYQSSWSPKDYNPWRNGGHTDEIYVDIELSEDWQDVFKTFMSENYEWLKDRIKKDWSSYDGFWSFMDDNVDDWHKHLFEDEDTRYIECMITYMMYINDKNIRYTLIYDALEDIYDGEYVIPANEEVEKKLDALRNNQ